MSADRNTVITCDCLESFNFLRNALCNMVTPWKDAKLQVMLLRELPAQPKAHVTIPLSVDGKQVVKGITSPSV